MTCKQCGKQLPEGSNFCFACGAPVAVETEAAEPEKQPIERAEEPVAKAAGPESEAEKEAAPALKKKKACSLGCACKGLLDDPALFVGLLLTCIAFVAGIVLLSISLASVLPAGYGIDFLVILPAFAALILNIFLFCKARKEGAKGKKLLTLIAICIAAFVLLFAFIACCVFNA